MPIGLTLNLNDSFDQEENYLNSTNTPQRPQKTNEQRMIKSQYINPEFKKDYNITSTSDIISLLSTAVNKTLIGKGTLSEGYIITLPNENQFIVRETNVQDPMTRVKLEHEIKIYNIIQSNPESTKYVSQLLYADIPLIKHRNSNLNKAYFVFRYTEGTTLENLIESQGQKYPFSTIMIWITQLSNAINFLDSLGIIHRDIKPQNIYINPTSNELLLFDLETACIQGVNCTSTEFRGTRAYAIPKALELANRTDNSGFKSYMYSKYSDYYSIIKIIENDFSMIVIPSDREQLLGYAKMMETEILKRGGGKRSSYYMKKIKKTKKRTTIKHKTKHKKSYKKLTKIYN